MREAQTQEERPLTLLETELISRIVAQSGPENVRYLSILAGLRVVEMDDGKMGSIYIVHPGKPKSARKFGHEIGTLMVKDSDAVDVSIALNVDRDGDLYELDIWKTDFSPTVKLVL